jgi:hypothetical protein
MVILSLVFLWKGQVNSFSDVVASEYLEKLGELRVYRYFSSVMGFYKSWTAHKEKLLSMIKPRELWIFRNKTREAGCQYRTPVTLPTWEPKSGRL